MWNWETVRLWECETEILWDFKTVRMWDCEVVRRSLRDWEIMRLTDYETVRLWDYKIDRLRDWQIERLRESLRERNLWDKFWDLNSPSRDCSELLSEFFNPAYLRRLDSRYCFLSNHLWHLALSMSSSLYLIGQGCEVSSNEMLSWNCSARYKCCLLFFIFTHLCYFLPCRLDCIAAQATFFV